MLRSGIALVTLQRHVSGSVPLFAIDEAERIPGRVDQGRCI
jgi:hypothetical protein